MPATNYSWPGSEKQQIFQVYGTKRKTTVEDDSMVEFSAKRMCTDSRPDRTVEEDCMMEDSTDCSIPDAQSTQLNNPQYHLPAQSQTNTHKYQQHTQLWNNRVPPLPDQTGDFRPINNTSRNNNNNHVNNDNNDLQPSEENNNSMQTHYSQDDMIMDLNDKLYSTAQLSTMAPTDAEYEAACSMMAAMDGEGAPNPDQYRMAFCDQYCAGGDTSPSSGRIRCFCKPSWEGLHDVRPYVSDYY